jgi:hypothetical protein
MAVNSVVNESYKKTKKTSEKKLKYYILCIA